MAKHSRGVAYGAWLLLAISIVALIVAAINTFNVGNGIAYTPGTYLVLFSTAMLVIGSLLITFVRSMPRWLSGLIAFLLLIDLLGTGLASYLLEATILVWLMVAGLVAWLIHVFADPASGKRSHPTATNREAMTS
ncbi:hypothetical protein [Modicisalibacter luteus]|uniref:Uncharacterized protein n=1 Tax=Modicisalibacter luteus TaxID=453962 RepID=A0ABV7LZW1_9GAMM|nr:hypothetical protein [Halomonas lutea]GHA94013.1 hypothetical protein GCM10007159_14630 [Halomonas lutea]